MSALDIATMSLMATWSCMSWFAAQCDDRICTAASALPLHILQWHAFVESLSTALWQGGDCTWMELGQQGILFQSQCWDFTTAASSD
jgi:hypothetical protein